MSKNADKRKNEDEGLTHLLSEVEDKFGVFNWSVQRDPEQGGYKFAFLRRSRTVTAIGDSPVSAVQAALDWLGKNNWDTEVEAMTPGTPYRVEGFNGSQAESLDGLFVVTQIQSPQHQQVPHLVLLDVLTSTTLVVPFGLGCSAVTWDDVAKAQQATSANSG